MAFNLFSYKHTYVEFANKNERVIYAWNSSKNRLGLHSISFLFSGMWEIDSMEKMFDMDLCNPVSSYLILNHPFTKFK